MGRNRHQIQPTYAVVTSDGQRRLQLALEAQIVAAGAAGVTTFNTRSGAVSLTTSDVTLALGSTPTSVTGLTGIQSVAAFKTGLTLVKGDVGLGSVDNTADATKNVLSATKLLTARNINGVAFDGTANITINAVDSTTRVPETRTISTTAPLAGGGDLTANRTLSITAATGAAAGSMSAADKTKLDATTGTNTGDETKATIDTKIGATGGTNFYRQDGTWAAAGGGSTVWGGITGTLSAQTDLQTALDTKATLSLYNNFLDGVQATYFYTFGDNTGYYLESASATADLKLSGAAAYFSSFNAAGTASNPFHIRGDPIYFAGFSGVARLTINSTGGVFAGTVSASNLSGTNTGNETKATIDTAIGATGGTTQFYRKDGTWVVPPGGGSPPTGTGFTHITAGVQDAAAKLVDTADINDAQVTLAKQANMATASLVYRKTAAAGPPEIQTLATLKTDLGLTGTNSGDQTITLTGDVTGSGTGSFATAIGANKVTDAMLAQIATATFKGRTTAGTGNVEALTATQATALLDAVVAAGAKGLMTGADKTKLDGIAAGAQPGTVTAVSVATANGVSGTSSGGTTPALTLTLGAITPTSASVTDDPFAAGWNGSTIVPTKNAVYDMAVGQLARYHSLLDCSGSHIAARVAGTYGMGQGDPLAITGTGILYPLNIIYLDPADYPSVGAITPKLRIRCTLLVNDVAPTGNFTIGLHPVTRPATSGGAGVVIHTIGAAVASSGVTATAPAADSSNNLVGTDFAMPAAGFYIIGVVTTATVAASSHLHFSAILQQRYT